MRNLKDSLGEYVDLEGQLYNLREKFSVMDSGILSYNFTIDYW